MSISSSNCAPSGCQTYSRRNIWILVDIRQRFPRFTIVLWLLRPLQGCKGGSSARPWRCRHYLESPVPNSNLTPDTWRGFLVTEITNMRLDWDAFTFSSITCFRIDRAMVSASWRVSSCRRNSIINFQKHGASIDIQQRVVWSRHGFLHTRLETHHFQHYRLLAIAILALQLTKQHVNFLCIYTNRVSYSSKLLPPSHNTRHFCKLT